MDISPASAGLKRFLFRLGGSAGEFRNPSKGHRVRLQIDERVDRTEVERCGYRCRQIQLQNHDGSSPLILVKSCGTSAGCPRLIVMYSRYLPFALRQATFPCRYAQSWWREKCDRRRLRPRRYSDRGSAVPVLSKRVSPAHQNDARGFGFN